MDRDAFAKFKQPWLNNHGSINVVYCKTYNYSPNLLYKFKWVSSSIIILLAYAWNYAWILKIIPRKHTNRIMKYNNLCHVLIQDMYLPKFIEILSVVGVMKYRQKDSQRLVDNGVNDHVTSDRGEWNKKTCRHLVEWDKGRKMLMMIIWKVWMIYES